MESELIIIDTGCLEKVGNYYKYIDDRKMIKINTNDDLIIYAKNAESIYIRSCEYNVIKIIIIESPLENFIAGNITNFYIDIEFRNCPNISSIYNAKVSKLKLENCPKFKTICLQDSIRHIYAINSGIERIISKSNISNIILESVNCPIKKIPSIDYLKLKLVNCNIDRDSLKNIISNINNIEYKTTVTTDILSTEDLAKFKNVYSLINDSLYAIRRKIIISNIEFFIAFYGIKIFQDHNNQDIFVSEVFNTARNARQFLYKITMQNNTPICHEVDIDMKNGPRYGQYLIMPYTSHVCLPANIKNRYVGSRLEMKKVELVHSMDNKRDNNEIVKIFTDTYNESLTNIKFVDSDYGTAIYKSGVLDNTNIDYKDIITILPYGVPYSYICIDNNYYLVTKSSVYYIYDIRYKCLGYTTIPIYTSFSGNTIIERIMYYRVQYLLIRNYNYKFIVKCSSKNWNYTSNIGISDDYMWFGIFSHVDSKYLYYKIPLKLFINNNKFTIAENVFKVIAISDETYNKINFGEQMARKIISGKLK